MSQNSCALASISTMWPLAAKCLWRCLSRPDRVAKLAEEAGADGIAHCANTATSQMRILTADGALSVPLNFEMAATDDAKIALR